jgi:O-antigen ligase
MLGLKSPVMIRHSGRLLTGLLAALLLWAPLPFGGVTPWAVASLEVLCFAALALAAASARLASLRPVAVPAAALAAVALFAGAQSLPWPPALVAALSPAHAELFARTASVPGVAAGGTYLSLAPDASRAAAFLWGAAAAALLAGAVAGRRRENRRWLAAAVLLGGLFQVFFGAQEQYLRSRLLWGVEIPVSPRLHGTFVNPNHLALYFEMALAVAFAWGWWAARRTRTEPLERRLLLLAGPVFCWLTLFLGLAFTGSRGGLLGAVLGVAAQGLLVAVVRRRWRSALLGLGAAAAGLIVVAAVSLHEGLGRVIDTRTGDVSLGARLTEYAAILRLWRRFPILGAGLGAFGDAFPLVQPASLQGTWWHAHSDVLELLSTAGAAGILLAAAGASALAWRLVAILRGHGRSEDRAAALALLGICAALAVHEMLDFGLTMPANALTLAILAGAAASVEIVRGRAGSAEPDRAGKHPAAADALEAEKVETGPERGVQPEHRARPRRKRSKKRPVHP